MILKILQKPSAILFSFLMAVLMKIFIPDAMPYMRIPSEIYSSCLQMCVIPLFSCSVIAAFVELIRHKEVIQRPRKLILVYLGSLVGITLLGASLTYLFPIGKFLAKDVTQFTGFEYGLKPLYLNLDDPIQTKQSLLDIFRSIFTSNILESISKSTFLQIVYASILIGCAAGYLTSQKQDVFNAFINSINDIFTRILKWITIFLPFGAFVIFGYAFNSITKDVLFFLFPFILFFYALSFLIIGLSNIAVTRHMGIGYFALLKNLKTPLLITVSTTSLMASLPTFVSALSEKMKLNLQLVSLFAPLGYVLCRFGNSFYYVILAVFGAQIFSVPLTFFDYIVIVVMSILVSFSSVSTGIVNIGLMSIVCGSVGIPSHALIVLFVVIDPIVDPIRGFINVYVNACATAFCLHEKTPNVAQHG